MATIEQTAKIYQSRPAGSGPHSDPEWQAAARLAGEGRILGTFRFSAPGVLHNVPCVYVRMDDGQQVTCFFSGRMLILNPPDNPFSPPLDLVQQAFAAKTRRAKRAGDNGNSVVFDA